MSLILNIDTASETAYVSIAKDGVLLQEKINTDAKSHASFLQPAIQSISKKIGVALHELDAVAVSAGPGSYTGLRVGMASAKGLCYALKKPLVTVSSLEILANDAIQQVDNNDAGASILFCPMIDARRMEVFTALYNSHLDIISPAVAVILEQNNFVNWLLSYRMYFFGSGAVKWEKVCLHPNAHFIQLQNNSLSMCALSYKKLMSNQLADLIYSAPEYIKEFQSNKGG